MKLTSVTAVHAALIGATMLLTPIAAIADQGAADACAADLSENAKKIYDAVAPTIEPGDNVQDKLKAKVKPMVQGGELSRGDAKSAAKEAKKCLDKLES